MRRETIENTKSVRSCDTEVSKWIYSHCILRRNHLEVRDGSSGGQLLVRLNLEKIRAVSTRIQDEVKPQSPLVKNPHTNDSVRPPELCWRFIIKINPTVNYAFASDSLDVIRDWTFHLQKAMATIIGKILKLREQEEEGKSGDACRLSPPRFRQEPHSRHDLTSPARSFVGGEFDRHYNNGAVENNQSIKTGLRMANLQHERSLVANSPVGDHEDDSEGEDAFFDMSPRASHSQDGSELSSNHEQTGYGLNSSNNNLAYYPRGQFPPDQYEIERSTSPGYESNSDGELLGSGVSFEMRACKGRNQQSSARDNTSESIPSESVQPKAKKAWVPRSLQRKREEEFKAGQRDSMESTLGERKESVRVHEAESSHGICPTILEQRQRIGDMLDSSITDCGQTSALISCQGVRDKMEDAHVIREDLPCQYPGKYSLFGVFDGHGGSLVANYAAERVPKYLSQEDIRNSPEEAFCTVFSRIDEEIKALWEQESEKRKYESGTTAVCLLINHDCHRFTIASLGDSQAVLCSDGKAVEVSTKHTPASEKRRIEKAGGWVYTERQIVLDNVKHLDVGDSDVKHIAENSSREEWIWPECSRVNGELGVSRAVGDVIYKYPMVNDMEFCWPVNHKKRDPPFSADLVLGVPSCSTHRIAPEDSFVLLACDGLFDVLSEEQAIDISRRHLSSHGELSTCRRLVEIALKLGSDDNITCMLVRLPTADK